MKQPGGERNGWIRRIRPALVPGILILCLIAGAIVLSAGNSSRSCSVKGMKTEVPEGYERTFSDSQYYVWEYRGSDGRKPGKLVIYTEIRGKNADSFETVDDVFRKCDWMVDPELYVNPWGVRMVRGYAAGEGNRERRYYIESSGAMFLLCMIENERFYDTADCEEMLLRTADSIRPENGRAVSAARTPEP